ncbi:MAG: zinc-dependent metalloprotease [Actinobacteria bacterium]|nr:zinc-dependent metalloprotease [Actinomycetota bacterium]
MSDVPDDPFGGLPDELRQMIEQLGGSQVFNQVRMLLENTGTGPVNWDLAGQVARQLAVEGDRAPTADERERVEDAQRLAEYWLDEGTLPAPPDAGHTRVGSRQEWVGDALRALRPIIEPVAEASTGALAELTAGQFEELGMPEELAALGMPDLSGVLRPMGAILTGIHTGQVVGRLARQLLGQYELGIPTAAPDTAWHLAVNISETFEGYELDPTEVAIALALTEGAHRRLFHAVPWLEGHIQALVASFAAGTQLDRDKLLELSNELALSFDPEDPESLRDAMESASDFRIDPTPEQQRVLERIQGVVCLVQAWARREIRAAASDRLPHLDRIDEVLRRRRAARGDGERMLQQLLGLDLKPADETVGDRFIAAVEAARGLEGLRRGMAHPENLPDHAELADPSAWLVRMASGEDIPDDAGALLDVGDAPHEASAEERFGRGQGDDDGDGAD